MMYIEQAPLGGKLLKILKNNASLSNGTEAKESNVVNGENSIPNGNCQASFLKRFEATGKHNINVPEEDFQKAQNSVATEYEEEEQYELIDVVEELDLDQTGKSQQESLPNGYVIEVNFCDSKPNISPLKNAEDLNAVSDNEAVEFDSDESTYCIVKYPKRKARNQRKAKFNSLFEQPQQLPAVPDAIPIDQYLKHQNKRVLNGISKKQQAIYAHEIPNRSRYDTSEYSCFDSNLEDDTFNDYQPIEEQMGIDILGGIRQFFNWNPKTRSSNRNSETTEIQLGKRKRRPENPSTAGLFKYRRVENNFPKIINHSLEDDADYLYRAPNLNTPRNPTNISKLIRPNHSGFEMTQRGAEPKSRRSWFKAPPTTSKTVRNTTYADIEFSDDDDDDATRLQQSLNRASALGTSNMQKQPRVRNIPIRQEQPSASSAIFKPALASSSITDRYSTPQTLFNMDSMCKPTYADALRYNMPFGAGVGHILNGRSISSNASSGSGASTSRLGNDFGNMPRLNTKSLGRSIISQDREREAHAQYKQLLETINRAQIGRSNVSKTLLMGNASKTPRLSTKFALPNLTRRAPLSSTINVDDDEYDYNDDDVTITGVTHLKPPKPTKKRETLAVPTVILDDVDDDISEIIDLEQPKNKTTETIDLDAKENKNSKLPFVEPINSLRDILNTMPILTDCWFKSFNAKWEEKRKLREAETKKAREIADKLDAERLVKDSKIQKGLRGICIVDHEILDLDEFIKPEIEEEPEFPELDDDRKARIKGAIYGPPDQVLIAKFNMNITRRDIQTLLGHNWLNDEVINFYMNLITERSEVKHETHGYPRVYAMNTFFLQRLSGGYGGVKRWTRKVNIFEKDLIPVPVHVGGVHWCMAIIHLKNRWIRYYDSMGSPNPDVLEKLEQYLKDESLDKRKQPFDTSGFVIESVRDVPRQMNGSDCGVFSCMFAEYVSRNKEITFSQQHMEYFRHKMILEIVQGELLL